MKTKLKSRISLIVVCVSLLVLAVSCKKDKDDLTVTDIDGNIYNIVTIGTQVWFKENLKTTKYNDGAAIPLITDANEWSSLTTHGFCWYNNDKVTYGNSYGAMYNWYAIASGKLCPAGWHVPSDAEWTILTNYHGVEGVAGGKMKSTRTSPDAHPRWDSPNTGANNKFDFSALPGGYRLRFDGSFNAIGTYGGWWSSTEDAVASAWTRSIYYDKENVYRYNDAKREAISVRCIKD